MRRNYPRTSIQIIADGFHKILSVHFLETSIDDLANKGVNSSKLIEDVGYEPKEIKNSQNSLVKTFFTKKGKIKIENMGDECRKCGEPVIKKSPKNRKTKPNQSYYYEYYLFCPTCKIMYTIEDGKREIFNENKLFE